MVMILLEVRLGWYFLYLLLVLWLKLANYDSWTCHCEAVAEALLYLGRSFPCKAMASLDLFCSEAARWSLRFLDRMVPELGKRSSHVPREQDSGLPSFQEWS